MNLRQKLWLAIGCCGLITLGCAGTLVLQSLSVIDITRYVPRLHPGEEAQDTAVTAADDAEEGIAEDNGTATPPDSGKSSKAEAGEDGAVDKDGTETDDTPTAQPDGDTAPREYGDIGTVVGTLPESPTGNPGSISTTVIKLHDSATAWAQPGCRPQIGDRIAINLPPDNERFIIRVVYIEEQQEGKVVVLYGTLEQLGASVVMMMVDGKLNIRIHDIARNRLYYVSLRAGSDEYIVEVWDAAKQVHADGCSQTHEHDDISAENPDSETPAQ